MSLSEILKMSMKQQSPVIVKETIVKEQPKEVKEAKQAISDKSNPQEVKQAINQEVKQQPVTLQTLPPVIIKEGRGKNQKEIVVPEDENIQKLYILLEEILNLYNK